MPTSTLENTTNVVPLVIGAWYDVPTAARGDQELTGTEGPYKLLVLDAGCSSRIAEIEDYDTGRVGLVLSWRLTERVYGPGDVVKLLGTGISGGFQVGAIATIEDPADEDGVLYVKSYYKDDGDEWTGFIHKSDVVGYDLPSDVLPIGTAVAFDTNVGGYWNGHEGTVVGYYENEHGFYHTVNVPALDQYVCGWDTRSLMVKVDDPSIFVAGDRVRYIYEKTGSRNATVTGFAGTELRVDWDGIGEGAAPIANFERFTEPVFNTEAVQKAIDAFSYLPYPPSFFNVKPVGFGTFLNECALRPGEIVEDTVTEAPCKSVQDRIFDAASALADALEELGIDALSQRIECDCVDGTGVFEIGVRRVFGV